MKKKVELIPLNHRTRAVSTDTELPETVKVVPIQFQNLVRKLGFIDVRSPKKLTLTSEERLLLYLHSFIPKLKCEYPGFQVDEIKLESKASILHRESGEHTYVVRIKDATEVTIPYSYYKKLNVPELKINRV